jgi:hypothetical protein
MTALDIKMIGFKTRVRPRKATSHLECVELEALPNIGPSLAQDLRLLGIEHPSQLAAQDAWSLYESLCRATRVRQDPCVLDTFMAVCDFMRGAPPAPWWSYTQRRKDLYQERLRQLETHDAPAASTHDMAHLP